MMEWEEHLREMAQVADGGEMMTETNAKPIEPTCSMCPSYPRIQAELDRLTAELKEREGEVERLRDMIADSHDELLQKFDSNAVGHTDLYTWIKCILAKLERLKSLAASRLADHDSYRAAVEDALVVANIGVASGDAKADLHKLICWEIDVALDPRVSKRAADLLAEKDAEIEKLTHERDLWENMAAMRLADQEAIERHTARRVAGEIREIIGYCESFSELANEITNRYGVE